VTGHRPLDVILWSGLCGLVAIVAEHLLGRQLSRYLRRQGL
jgi:hypothetical protein